MLTTKQASERLIKKGLHLSSNEVANLANQGILPNAEKTGNIWLIPESSLELFIQQRLDSDRAVSSDNYDSKQKVQIVQLLRDPVWQAVAALVAILTLVLAVVPLIEGDNRPDNDTFSRRAYIHVFESYYPTGWIDAGDTENLSLEDCLTSQDCRKFEYCPNRDDDDPDGYNIVSWQYPDNNWCNKGEGLDLSDAQELTFRAWGEAGGELVTFGYGLQPKCESLDEPVRKDIELTSEPQEYRLSVADTDISNLVHGFVVEIRERQNPQNACIAFSVEDVLFQGVDE